MGGCIAGTQSENKQTELYEAKTTGDGVATIGEVSQRLRECGLESSNLIFGIDYTASNMTQGSATSFNPNLHAIDSYCRLLNPYQQVISILGRTLAPFDEDGIIPAYGFGDATTQDRRVFPFKTNGYCKGFEEVLTVYNRITRKVQMSGPTNFAPLIREAIRIVRTTRKFHILVIAADGQVNDEQQTLQAICDASNYPLSIVMVGVGDGPWDMMEDFDDSIPERNFDNFQFVNMHEVMSNTAYPETSFALEALMEIPDQFRSIRKLGLLNVR